MEEIKKFARYFTPYKWNVIFGIVFIFFGMLFGLYVPYLIGHAIDDIKISLYNNTLNIQKISLQSTKHGLIN